MKLRTKPERPKAYQYHKTVTINANYSSLSDLISELKAKAESEHLDMTNFNLDNIEVSTEEEGGFYGYSPHYVPVVEFSSTVIRESYEAKMEEWEQKMAEWEKWYEENKEEIEKEKSKRR